MTRGRRKKKKSHPPINGCVWKFNPWHAIKMQFKSIRLFACDTKTETACK